MTTKRIFITAVLLVVGLPAIYVVTWLAATLGYVRNVEFGYYGDFNVAKHALEKCGCAEKIEYAYVNRDVHLEEFRFKVRTRSGQVVRLFFDGSSMDVNQVCYAPVGISVSHSAFEGVRRYSPEFLSERIRVQGIQVEDLNDVICNMDELEEIFRTTPEDPKAARPDDPYVWDYLRVRILTEEALQTEYYRDDHWTEVRDKDIVDWH